MIVYKIVNIKNGKLYSCAVSSEFPEEFRVEYKIDEMVKPVISGTMLFAFSDLNEAKVFKKDLEFASFSFEYFAIYEAETSRVVRNIKPQNLSRKIFLEFWEDFKKARKEKRALPKDGPDPQFGRINDFKSCVCCPSLKLTKQII